MNYQKLYDNLVSFRQVNPACGYTERHHILMRSMGGSDDPTNLVVLTGREHWIAHLLLHKIHGNSNTAHACHMMAMRCEERGIAHIKNSRMYESIRKECIKLTSGRMKIIQNGNSNSQYGTCWICNCELKENKKILKTDELPFGWIYGRNKWNAKMRSTRGSAEHIRKLSLAASARKHSDHTRSLLSAAAKRRKFLNKDKLDSIYASRKGKKRSDETKKKMSLAHTKRAFV